MILRVRKQDQKNVQNNYEICRNFSNVRRLRREGPNYKAFNLNKYLIKLNMHFDWRVFGLFIVNIWLVIVIEQLCTCVLSNTVISGSLPIKNTMHQIVL